MNPYILLGGSVFLGFGIGFAHSGEFGKLVSLQFHMAGLSFFFAGIIYTLPMPFVGPGDILESVQVNCIIWPTEFIVSIIFCFLNLAPRKEIEEQSF
jgi:hypothetical protein